MVHFVALYRGRTVLEATLVAVSAEPRLVARFLHESLGEDAKAEECPQIAHRDTVPTLTLAKREG